MGKSYFFSFFQMLRGRTEAQMTKLGFDKLLHISCNCGSQTFGVCSLLC